MWGLEKMKTYTGKRRGRGEIIRNVRETGVNGDTD